ncbi:MAG: RtcB family protein [Candidatus Saccharimonadales bacterium]|nr:RtcB family protein [Candidatus Saccharimonadales bacterium]
MTNLVTPPKATKIKQAGMKLPVVSHTKIEGLPNKETMKTLQTLSKDDRLFSHIAALNDAHQKQDLGSPTGSTIASKNYVIPQLFDSAPNCGMRIIATDLMEKEVARQDLPEILKALSGVVPTNALFGKNLPRKVGIESFLHGSAPVDQYLGSTVENEVQNTQDHGNHFAHLPQEFHIKDKKDLHDVIAPLLVYLGKFRLGILGATSSHFVILMKVDKILDEDIAKQLGLAKDQYVLYMHTGSGIIGRFIGYMYSPQNRNRIQDLEYRITKFGYFSKKYRSLIVEPLKNWDQSQPLLGYDVNSEAGLMAIKALLAAGNQGFANRTVLTHEMRQSLNDHLGRDVDFKLVYDAPHILLSREKHFGQSVWVHRNGSTRAYGPSSLEKGSAYQGVGEPGFFAPFENTYAYAGVGTDHNQSTFMSANHEIGKTDHIPPHILDSLGSSKTLKQPLIKIAQNEVRTIEVKSRGQKYGKMIAEEISDNGILKLAVRMQPIAHLTHRHD